MEQRRPAKQKLVSSQTGLTCASSVCLSGRPSTRLGAHMGGVQLVQAFLLMAATQKQEEGEQVPTTSTATSQCQWKPPWGHMLFP